VACRSYRPKYVRALRPQKGDHMIVFLCVSIKEIVEQGRDFPWPRPEICPRCGSTRVWGHGFVSAIFDGFVSHALLRRWRCPECHCVVRVRPGGYFPRFQASIETIRSSIAVRLEDGRWPRGGSRQRQGHWLRSLRRRVGAFLGQGWKSRLLEGFDSLMLDNESPVCRRI